MKINMSNKPTFLIVTLFFSVFVISFQDVAYSDMIFSVPYAVQLTLKDHRTKNGYVQIESDVLSYKENCSKWIEEKYLPTLRSEKVSHIELYSNFKCFDLSQFPKPGKTKIPLTDRKYVSINVSDVLACHPVKDPVNAYAYMEHYLALPTARIEEISRNKIISSYFYGFDDGNQGGDGFLISFNPKIGTKKLVEIFGNSGLNELSKQIGTEEKRQQIGISLFKKYKIELLEFTPPDD